MASESDIKVASLAAGFTLGFGFLTVWEAMKQTRRNRNPLRSIYIYMVWGEIAANIAIGIIGWLFLDGILGPSVVVLFFILFLWVFEIQFLMQIIINRIAVIAENRKTTEYLRWGTATVITMINIAVFCIWIPAHTLPPVSHTFVRINEYWDRTSKVLILLVDAGLNYYFLRTVKIRLVKQHGLVKYAPLVGFNAKLMVLSIMMDAMLIGLMSLPNQVVYIQFHPVAYMVKLNIEMSMASLISRLAQSPTDAEINPNSLSQEHGKSRDLSRYYAHDSSRAHSHVLKSFHRTSIGASPADDIETILADDTGIHRRTDLDIQVESAASSRSNVTSRDTDKTVRTGMEDEQSLTNAVHPKGSRGMFGQDVGKRR
ncbi:hypothetical protein QBC46DRAFT_427607 [Diplogelasinospora grovesii]|uniref:Uncharacterized protein n=1 Tax=Diplogelasinospora grovesii TaxID=303347 RepID=A0AAN6RZ14_9PEZI|nr:hypothetical protein QBC46DRAFT_427607 [Diplogelasinospora grovesii]